MSLLFHAKILGKRWQVVEKSMPASFGECDSPDKMGKQIRLLSHSMSETERLDTLIHECTHAAFFCLNEQVVAKYATQTAKWLLANGCQRGEFSGDVQDFINLLTDHNISCLDYLEETHVSEFTNDLATVLVKDKWYVTSTY
jgi:hypothetical protein